MATSAELMVVVRRMLRWNLLLGALAAVVMALACGFREALAAAVAAGLGAANTWVLSKVVARMLEGGGAAYVALVLPLKFVLLCALFALAVMGLHLPVIGVGVGFTTTVVSLLIGAVASPAQGR
jgi:hypothetical protein